MTQFSLKKGCLSGSTLKIIAIIAMAIDHFRRKHHPLRHPDAAKSVLPGTPCLYDDPLVEHLSGHALHRKNRLPDLLLLINRRIPPHLQQKEICHPLVPLCPGVRISL